MRPHIINKRKMFVLMIFLLLLVLLGWVENSLAQIKKEEVDFEVLATVTIIKGDTLQELAKNYYDDASLWVLIREYNKIPDEKRILPGTVIYIPVEDAKSIVMKVEEIDQRRLKEEIYLLREALKKSKYENMELTKELKESKTKIAESETRDTLLSRAQSALKNLSVDIEKPKEPLAKPSAEKDDTPDSQLDVEKMVNIVYKAPLSMALTDADEVELVVSRKQMEELVGEIDIDGEETRDSVLVPSLSFRAKLGSIDFEIDQVIGDEETAQYIGKDIEDIAKWKWGIKAKTSGHLSLDLTLYAGVLNENGVETYLYKEQYKAAILVNVKWGQKVASFMSHNWQWFCGALIFPLAGWLWRRRRKTRKSNSQNNESAGHGVER